MNYRFLLMGIVTSPLFLIWVAALVLSVIRMKRGGGRTERFLVIGSIFMLLSAMVSGSSAAVVDYVIQNGSSPGVAISRFTWAAGLIALPGIICLFYAVWKKFSDKRSGVTIENPTA